MRFLILSSLFPPDYLGGAELSAWNLAQALRRKGHDIAVLTSARKQEDELHGAMQDGVATWRIHMPRPYAMYDHPSASKWKKPMWHLQDYFDPRNKKILEKVLDAFRPDIVHIHLLVGLGYNMLGVLADRKIPVVYVLHDLGLICVRSGMFKNKTGKDCAKPCALCALSSWSKKRKIQRIEKIGYVSPSEANLNKAAEFFPIKERVHKVILNPNTYPKPTTRQCKSRFPRILYAGRLHRTKGVDVLLEALTALAQKYAFHLTIAGSGPEEDTLRAQYDKLSWCTFLGHISQQEVSNLMLNSDLICLPSIWKENSPGSAIQALWLGLPVMGSNVGGIPELVEDGVTGRLVSAGDVKEWKTEIEKIMASPDILNKWHENALTRTSRFDTETLVEQYLQFHEDLLHS